MRSTEETVTDLYALYTRGRPPRLATVLFVVPPVLLVVLPQLFALIHRRGFRGCSLVWKQEDCVSNCAQVIGGAENILPTLDT